MKKTLIVEGMSCGHCVARVEKALKMVDGVSAVEIDLSKKMVSVEMSQDLANELLRDVIDEAGYDVVSISE